MGLPDRVRRRHARSCTRARFPWTDGEHHKREFARMFRYHAPFLSVARDHGEGTVVLDDQGQALVRWSLDDEVDRRLMVRAQVELARLHHAAGAPEIRTLHAVELSWRADSDEPFEEFITRIEAAPYGPADLTIFTAHQMGSCRLGSDPTDSVADGRGQLHDVRGVWIGDGSAFPSAPGRESDGLDHVTGAPDRGGNPARRLRRRAVLSGRSGAVRCGGRRAAGGGRRAGDSSTTTGAASRPCAALPFIGGQQHTASRALATLSCSPPPVTRSPARAGAGTSTICPRWAPGRCSSRRRLPFVR